MAKLVHQRDDASFEGDMKSAASNGGNSKVLFDHGAPLHADRLPPESSLFGILFQLIPMFIVYPVWQVTRYLLFFGLLLWSIENIACARNIAEFAFALIAFQIIWITVTALIFVAIKWFVIGRYKPGRYPIWGSYYLRWWFVDIYRNYSFAVFNGSNKILLNWFYRLLGARIGVKARISLECHVAEFDLLEVGG